MKLTPQVRLVFALLNLMWFAVALYRVTSWIHGHPVARVTLVLALITGVAGLVGFCSFAIQRKHTD